MWCSSSGTRDDLTPEHPMTITVLTHKIHPLGGYYLAQQDDGSYLAGRSPDSARTFENAQAVFDWFHEFAMDGSHWAWNICYEIEDYL